MSEQIRTLTEVELDTVSAGALVDVVVANSLNNLAQNAAQNLAQNAQVPVAAAVGVLSGVTTALSHT